MCTALLTEIAGVSRLNIQLISIPSHYSSTCCPMPPTARSVSDLLLDGDDPPRTASLIGIAVAISGNIVISLALNAQKLAHRRIEEAGSHSIPRRRSPKLPSSADDVLLKRYQSPRLSGQNGHLDTSPLKPRGSSFARYGAAVSSRLNPSRRIRLKNEPAPISDAPEGSGNTNPTLLHAEPEEYEDESRTLIDNESIQEEDEEGLRDFDEVLMDADEIPEAKSESAYLKSKLWYIILHYSLVCHVSIIKDTIKSGGLVSPS